MNETKTLRLNADAAGIAQAVDIWQHGGLVALPTETVYGLAADARDDTAVARIYEAKGRPSFNPLIVHVPDMAAAMTYCDFNDDARMLAQAFWPGALTLVLPIKPDAGVSKLVTAGLSTLAIRVPDHALARDALTAFGGPIAAPSANPSGRISPTTADHVMAGLEGRIDAVIDGGACPVGVESTIVSCVGEPVLLRAGGVPAEALAACLGRPLLQSDDPNTPQSPGQLASHYAPVGAVRLNATDVREGETLLGFGNVAADLNLSKSGDLVEAAARLFDCLHQLDQMGAARIAVSPIPNTGLGAAINDRLQRAAAPRD
ncbi:L-threonylcarbamoyladenylate synthase [Loktanella ponticola]|uniref:Threonylcarbamoyl-AMP synthase n=1 Tax=Yoonia ponticola TaxID=1524255 RepID=A0A7W9BLX0_9RHOB|nr:L-threonylcarbamoyladenylate synthase [Yoonia ponticola]MBB5722944.1 L-threonylcarbamoyladenylate synthase [Yoonia ponticola]